MDWTWLTETRLLGDSPLRWLLALLVVLAVFVGLHILRTVARRRLTVLAARTRTVADDILSDLLAGVRTILILTVALWAGTQLLTLTPRAGLLIDKSMTLILIVQAALWGNRALGVATDHYKTVEGLDSGRRTTLAALSFLGRLALFSLLALAALDNLGIDITALLAGLGIASIGVGLALQNIMSDLFGSLSIILDKPFEIGDYIVIADLSGTVEHIGLRTTRLRSLSGEQLVYSNADLLQSRIRNYKRMLERRAVFEIRVPYETPRDRLAEIPKLIRGIVEAREPVRFDRAHFQGFGASALTFEVVYWMLDPDYALYMDVQQAINLELLHAFDERGIEMAYPTQRLWVEGPDVGPDRGRDAAPARGGSTGRSA